MYTGSLGAVSNQEDWVVTVDTLDDSGNAVSIEGAILSLFVTTQDNTQNSLISHSTSDGVVVIAPDGLSFTWTVPASEMISKLPCSADYAVFLRMLLNGVNSQLISAQVSVVDGGPSS
jgi:hypothetical protein